MWKLRRLIVVDPLSPLVASSMRRVSPGVGMLNGQQTETTCAVGISIVKMQLLSYVARIGTMLLALVQHTRSRSYSVEC